jgi:hypothetical protein
MRAMRGDTVIPNGVNEGEVSVNVFVINWEESRHDRYNRKNKRGRLTREIMSTRSPAEVNPYSANSAGEFNPK